MSSLVSPIEEFEMNSKCGRGRVLTALMSAQLMQVKKKRNLLHIQSTILSTFT